MLFLDLDGTVVDAAKRHYGTYVEVLNLSDVRGVPIPEREYWGLRREGKPWQEIVKRSRVLPTKYKIYQERFDERLETPEMLELDTLRTGTETFLGKMYTKVPIVLLTLRKDGEALESQLAQLGIRKYFVTVLFGTPPANAIRRRDPDARWKHKAFLVRARYKILPTESLLIGDTETDVQCARDLSFESMLVEGGHRKKELQMKADPDRIVADLPAALKHILAGGRWQR